MITVFDDRTCELGESPLWHPERRELIWVDMFGKKLMMQDREWSFDVYVSALGWIDHSRIILASENELMTFDLDTSQMDHVIALEADTPSNRSNDGRADPWGGFWISTMGKKNEPNAGSIYRYYRGELRKLFAGLTIPNSICFQPDAPNGYFADTDAQSIYRVRLNSDTGWPLSAPEPFIDLTGEDLYPDGSVFDAQGRLWNAQWGASRVACYKDGVFEKAINVPTSLVTCPAFGGDDGNEMFITTSNFETSDTNAGKLYSIRLETSGIFEPRVLVE